MNHSSRQTHIRRVFQGGHLEQPHCERPRLHREFQSFAYSRGAGSGASWRSSTPRGARARFRTCGQRNVARSITNIQSTGVRKSAGIPPRLCTALSVFHFGLRRRPSDRRYEGHGHLRGGFSHGAVELLQVAERRMGGYVLPQCPFGSDQRHLLPARNSFLLSVTVSDRRAG